MDSHPYASGSRSVNYPATTNAASASAAARRSKTEHTMVSSLEKVSIDDHLHHASSNTAMSDAFDELRDVRGGVVYRSIPFLESKPSSHLSHDINSNKKQHHYSESIDNKQTFKLPQTDANHPGFVVFDPLNAKDAKPIEKRRSTQQQSMKHSIKALPIPILLEKNSNILVTGSLNEIADSVTELLHTHGVDVSFKPEKCKWIGVAYAHNRELSLRVFLYKAPSTAISNSNESDNSTKEHYILEFQRREVGFIVTFLFPFISFAFPHFLQFYFISYLRQIGKCHGFQQLVPGNLPRFAQDWVCCHIQWCKP